MRLDEYTIGRTGTTLDRYGSLPNPRQAQHHVAGGKPPLPRDTPTETVGCLPVRPTTVRLDDDLRAWLKNEAERRGMSESTLIREALVFYAGFIEGYYRRMDPPDQKQPASKSSTRASKPSDK